MKDILKITTIIVITILTYSSAFAQQGKPSKEEMEKKMKVLKVSFLTEKLDLTETEAQMFWPVYNQFEDEMMSLRPEKNPGERPNIEEMSDQDIENKVQETFAMGYKKIQIQEVYFEKFKEILPMQKVMKMYMAEKEFKKEIIAKFKERKQGPPKE